MTTTSSRRRRHPLPWLGLVVAVALVATAVAVAAGRRTPAPDHPPGWALGRRMGGALATSTLVPPRGTLLGAWINPDGGRDSAAAQQQAWAGREALIGRDYDIGHQFHPFGQAFPGPMERWHLRQGRIPLISWNGTGAAGILDGGHDDLIRTRARAVAALGAPVMVRFWWEPDATSKQAWGSPEQYVAAWRHVHDLFVASGALNVAWVWCPTSNAFADGTAQRWWPGDGYVDWVCADGYNFAPARPGDRWRSFASIFRPFYDWAVRRDKPIMIGEFGVLERSPGEKATWFRRAAAALSEQFPRVRAVVYFDSARRVGGSVRDWRIDTSPGAATAFRALAQQLAATRPR